MKKGMAAVSINTKVYVKIFCCFVFFTLANTKVLTYRTMSAKLPIRMLLFADTSCAGVVARVCRVCICIALALQGNFIS